MGNVLTTFLFSLGVAAWAYNKFQNNNGGLTQRSLIGAGVAFVMCFIVFLSIISFVSSKITP